MKYILLVLMLWCFDTIQSKRCANNGLRYPTPQRGLSNMFCNAYSNETCCTPETDEKIKHGGEYAVDGTRWDECGTLSAACKHFHERETCRYECSPNLEKYIVKAKRGGGERFRGIPVCSSFCDNWYSACENDMICAKNWVKDFKWLKDGNHCKQPCRTYKEVYGSGKELCDNIWWHAMHYSTDQTKCVDV